MNLSFDLEFLGHILFSMVDYMDVHLKIKISIKVCDMSLFK